jgi:hypothetical protein
MFIHHFSNKIARLRVSRLNAAIQLNSLPSGRATSQCLGRGKTQLRNSVLDVGHCDAHVNTSIQSNVFAVAGHCVSSHRVSRLKAA